MKIKNRMFRQAKFLVLRNGVFLLLTLLFAAGLKYHYSLACSDDLAWILGPTAGLVEQISGVPFEKENRTGYVSHTHRIIIAPACAGVNFFIIAFCMAVVSGIFHMEQMWLKFLWLTVSSVSAYLFTIFVNTMRILLSLYSYNADIYSVWITPQRVHRLTGTLIYFFFLCFFYMIIKKVLLYYCLKRKIKRTSDTWSGLNQPESVHWMLSGLVPLFWYILITLAIPLLNAAYKGNEAQFFEHSWMVVAGCLGILASLFLFQAGWKYIRHKIHGNYETEDPYRGR